MDIGRNSIRDEGAEKLAEGISKLHILTHLNLNFMGNGIGILGAAKLGEGVSKLNNLSYFKLDIAAQPDDDYDEDDL